MRWVRAHLDARWQRRAILGWACRLAEERGVAVGEGHLRDATLVEEALSRVEGQLSGEVRRALGVHQSALQALEARQAATAQEAQLLQGATAQAKADAARLGARCLWRWRGQQVAKMWREGILHWRLGAIGDARCQAVTDGTANPIPNPDSDGRQLRGPRAAW